MTWDEIVDDICAAVPINDRTLAYNAGIRAAEFIGNIIPYNVSISIETFATSEAYYNLDTDFSITDFGRMLSINRVDAIRSPILEVKDPETIIQMNASTISGLLAAYSLEGTNGLRFYPWPEVGSQIVLRYVPSFDSNIDLTDETTFVHPMFHDAIVYYGASKIAVRESVRKASDLKMMFNEEMAEYRKWMRTRDNAAWSALEVGYPGNWNGHTHRNDIYP